MIARSLLKTLASSSLALSISVVKRPFKTNGVFYAAGTVITDPAAIRLYRTKVAEGKIVEVDEHNIDRVSEYLLHKQGEEAKALFDQGFLIVTAEELAYIEDLERTAQKEAAEAAAKEAAEAAAKAEADKKVEADKKAAEVKKPSTAPKTT
ncbi:hypothetical protein D3C71_234910 [compost metagenome]